MEYGIHLTCLFLILSIAVLGQGLLMGQAGVVLVAAGALMGIGAYGSAYLALRHGVAVPLAMVTAASFCMVVGCVVGLGLYRLEKDYLALASLGVGLILQDVFYNWIPVTNGPIGVPGLPPVTASNYWLLGSLILTVIIGIFLLLIIRRSSFGSLLRAVRDDEELVHSLGQSTLWPRLVVLSGSFFLIGLAGAWLGHYLSFIDPTTFSIDVSISILAMAIVGGSEHPLGAVVGAAVFVFLPEVLRFLGLPANVASQVNQILFGVLLIVLMVLRPHGLIGKYRLT